MRCYFMRDGHIGAVEVLAARNDDEAIAAAKALFDRQYGKSFEGFEIWDRSRFVHRYPSNDNAKKGNGHKRGKPG